ncbi:MAG: hypothetical protein AAF202_05015, partial [Pseudomonadota bacterium]
TLVEHTSLTAAEIADRYIDTQMAVFKMPQAPGYFLAITWQPPNTGMPDRFEKIDLSTLRAITFVHASSEEPYQRRGERASSSLVRESAADIEYGLRGAYLDPTIQKELRSFLFDIMKPLEVKTEGARNERLRFLHKMMFKPHSRAVKSGPVWEQFLDAYGLRCREQIGHQFSLFDDM